MFTETVKESSSLQGHICHGRVLLDELLSAHEFVVLATEAHKFFMSARLSDDALQDTVDRGITVSQDIDNCATLEPDESGDTLSM